jgi:ribulose-phosphate 3-epimerase
MALIAPSILSADFTILGEEIKRAEQAGADWIHVDVMDGRFVPNITIGQEVVRSIRRVTSIPFDVHLMIVEPERYIKEFAEAGSDYITVHYEASVHLHRTVQSIKEEGVRAGVSINPATPVMVLDEIIAELDLVLIMSVNPGFGGQGFIEESLRKISQLKRLRDERGLNFLIEVDGGIKVDNAQRVIDAGADVLVMGSGFFNSPDYEDVIRRIRNV